ncbi:general transcription factor 3C polypeptide 5-like [Gigantopelta aegis]|uniref:general transcription factor 3C polypeptide 5-like n=1 Tax=Gigantopelta aegis TaxID=1735272 RepID=UPI001B88943A|nr:general transcription factor 3C polypeptide 5-like [Gigantopelta aegis]
MASGSSIGLQLCETETSRLTTNSSLIPYSSKRLVCVEHPAVIKNLDRALQSLGGTKEISKTYNQETKRLELHCRPDDPYCKPAYGDRCKTTNLLMKVKRRQKRTKEHGESVEDSYEYCVEILGIVDTTYKFQAMADFQYLPMTRNEDGSYKSLLDKLMLKSFVKKSEFLKRDPPLFLTPLIFSRMDLPSEYDFRPDRGYTLKKTAEQELYLPDNHIGTVVRHRRSIYTMFVSYDDPTPTKPKAGSEEFLMGRFNKNTDLLETVRKLFEDRPVWSKNALRCHINSKLQSRLKYVLPLLAYYMTTGPWRAMWVKLGYDPRTNPSAKKYQLLDFRIRQRGACDPLPIRGKRGVFLHAAPMTITRYRPTVPQIPSLAQKPVVPGEYKDSVYRFEPNVMPPYRQMFYQLCDIHESNIQKLILENDGEETVCTEKDGWCSKDTSYKCRQILSECIEKLVQNSPSVLSDVSTVSGSRHTSSNEQELDDIDLRNLKDKPKQGQGHSRPKRVTDTTPYRSQRLHTGHSRRKRVTDTTPYRSQQTETSN